MTDFWTRIDRFLGVQEGDAADFIMNCRLILAIASLLILIASALGIFGLITEGLTPKRALGPLLIGFSILSIATLRRTRSVRIPAIMVIGAVTVINGLYVYTSDGLDGYAMPVMGAVPLIVALLFGARQAMLLTLGITGYVWLLLMVAPPSDHNLLAMAMVYSFVFLAIGVLAMVFSEINRQLRLDLVSARDEAIRNAGTKASFLANMSHEIRTPLNGVMGMAQLLNRIDLPEPAQEYANIIHSSSFSLLTIINDILDFSKIEAGKLSLAPAPCNLRQTLADVSALIRPAAEDKGLEFVMHYPAAAPENIIADAGRLRQVILNLAGNAIKFTQTGRVVIRANVTAQSGMADITLQVIDTGIGIAEDRLHAIFEQFSQADNSTTREFGGTGLGLSISKSLVDAMGGTLTVTSKLGTGSAFTLRARFPLIAQNVLRMTG